MGKSIAVVTGGAGFIGSHMVDLLLKKNFKVRVIDTLVGGHEKNLYHHKDNPDLEVHIEDIRYLPSDTKIFKNVSYVFHFAGIGDIIPSIENPTEYMETNVQGTIKILECSRVAKIKKFVYAASSSCYGLAKTPTNENHPIDPQYPYALSKLLGENAVMHWLKVYKVQANSIRIFNAYGTRVRTTGAYGAVFGVLLKQKLENKPLTIVGNGEQKRDFVYVTDVAKAFYLASQSSLSGRIYNLGANNPQSINYLSKLIGGKVTYIPERPGEPKVTWADTNLIKSDLKWEPKITFEDGVSKMLKNIDHWKDAPLWDKDKIENATKLWFDLLSKTS